MADTRHKDAQWILRTDANGRVSWEQIIVAVLMDIRDEMKRLNTLLHCQNFIAIPRKLDAIHRKMPTRRKRKAKP